jgi:hypothetical protein
MPSGVSVSTSGKRGDVINAELVRRVETRETTLETEQWGALWSLSPKLGHTRSSMRCFRPAAVFGNGGVLRERGSEPRGPSFAVCMDCGYHWLRTTSRSRRSLKPEEAARERTTRDAKLGRIFKMHRESFWGSSFQIPPAFPAVLPGMVASRKPNRWVSCVLELPEHS